MTWLPATPPIHVWWLARPALDEYGYPALAVVLGPIIVITLCAGWWSGAYARRDP